MYFKPIQNPYPTVTMVTLKKAGWIFDALAELCAIYRTSCIIARPNLNTCSKLVFETYGRLVVDLAPIGLLYLSILYLFAENAALPKKPRKRKSKPWHKKPIYLLYPVAAIAVMSLLIGVTLPHAHWESMLNIIYVLYIFEVINNWTESTTKF